MGLRRSRAIPKLALVLWLIGASGQLPAARQEGLSPVEPPAAAPPFELPDLMGRGHRLSAFTGQVLVVNFWASWCAPCRAELPSMNRAAAALQADGVVMLAINVGEESDAVGAFVADYPIDFTVLLDSRTDITAQWQVRGLPTTFVLDRSGNIVYRAIGERDWDDPALLRQVRELTRRDRAPAAAPLQALLR